VQACLPAIHEAFHQYAAGALAAARLEAQQEAQATLQELSPQPQL
jgi:hypothetical protein